LLIDPGHFTVSMAATMRICSLLLALPLVAFPASSNGAAECKETNFGKCFSVHGRYNIYADGDAIWMIGTKRLLETIDDKLDNMLERAGWEDHSVVGDFVVCPESLYQPRQKQSVCIQSYKNIRLGPFK
jgi:hypothetical protein